MSGKKVIFSYLKCGTQKLERLAQVLQVFDNQIFQKLDQHGRVFEDEKRDCLKRYKKNATGEKFFARALFRQSL